MPARILIVDDHFQNIKFLEARLAAEYYQVISASCGADAIDFARRNLCDMILLDVMMPGLDGFETCRRLKADPLTAHIPVVMVTALDQPVDRLRGLEAGADDFLTKPVDDLALIARLRSLTRLKLSFDELYARAKEAGFSRLFAHSAPTGAGARLLLVEDVASLARHVSEALSDDFEIRHVADAQLALFEGVEGNYDLALINLGLKNADALRLCAQFRALERTRDLPLMVLAEADARARILRALDLGVNDFVQRPFHIHELKARIATHLRRKAMLDHLRDNLRASIEWALIDPLTGLHNRRALERKLDELLARGTQLSLMILDLDHFKRVNDSHGHDAGDDVLRIVAQRLRAALRGDDLLCRLGGEEFAVLMPGTDLATAALVAERARAAIAGEPVLLGDTGLRLAITVSAGLAEAGAGMAPRDLYRLADAALYCSKELGRDRVTAHGGRDAA
jgi:two-component system cell cycle response regulator